MVTGGFGRTTGFGDVWIRLRVPLIEGRPLDGLARFAVMADSANGISAPKSMRDWWVIPPGVTMHLHRYPVGEWIRLTATSDPGQDGIGLTEAVRLAVRRELEREARAVPLRERIASLRREVMQRPGTGLEADKAFFDDLSGDL